MRFTTKTVTKISYYICYSSLLNQEREWQWFYSFLVYSFVELYKTLLKIDGAMYILSDKFDQDPLEEHFGMKSGGIDYPTVENSGHKKRKIILAKSEMLIVMQGNTRKRYRDGAKIDVHDERELPKQKKK